MLFPCLQCCLAIRVIAEPEEITDLIGERSSFWPASYPCPTCGEKLTALEETDVDPSAFTRLGLIDLTVTEAFAAFEGFGLPEEHGCSASTVVDQLTGAGVARVKVQDVPNTGRSIIEFIELDNGTRIYLGASTVGAVVYPVTRPSSYLLRMMHESA